MKLTSFKNFIHYTYLKKEVLEFIIHFIDENQIEIEDILLQENELREDGFMNNHLEKNRVFLSYLLAYLLQSSIIYEQHKDKVKKMLSLTHLIDKPQSLYDTLLKSAKGRELVQQNKQYQNQSVDEAFKDLLREASADLILKFITENRKAINIDVIYDLHHSYTFKLSFIEILERKGFILNEKIIPYLFNHHNFKNIPKLLSYIEKYKNNTKEEEWNEYIFKIIQQTYFNKDKITYKDSILLLKKLKNPSQYKWGENFNYDYFIKIVFEPIENIKADKVAYLDKENRHLEKEKFIDFIQENPMLIGKVDRYIFKVLPLMLPYLTNDIIQSAIDNNWEDFLPFENKEKKGWGLSNHKYDNLLFDFLNRDDDNEFLEHPFISTYMLKKYIEDKLKLDNYDERKFFKKLGIDKESIREGVLEKKYKDSISTLNTIEYILTKLDFKEQEINEYKVNWLNLNLENKIVVAKRKI